MPSHYTAMSSFASCIVPTLSLPSLSFSSNTRVQPAHLCQFRKSTCHRSRAAPLAMTELSQLKSLIAPAVGGQLTVGSLLGFATGYAVKRVGQAILILVGVQIISLQLMDQRGWVVVNWNRIEKDLAPHVGENQIDRVVNAVRIKAPFAGAFTAGCYAGFRWS